jgi:hypothetical protein
VNVKDHLWKEAHRKKDGSIDAERDKRLFRWAYDRIVTLENALGVVKELSNERNGAEEDDPIVRVVDQALK